MPGRVYQWLEACQTMTVQEIWVVHLQLRDVRAQAALVLRCNGTQVFAATHDF
jgi:hypothetical protein